jgi:hypothetical protein
MTKPWLKFFMKRFFILFSFLSPFLFGQNPPYDISPEAEPPFYRVRYEASVKPGELIFPVQYTIWIPKGVEKLKGVVIHQHGCGEGSGKSGLTGAWDLHWQALAEKHDCALLSPTYEQPGKADCQMWCDPRNGANKTFLKSLHDLGKMSGHPELSEVPWALWGHSGGGHWVGGMTMLYPNRVIACWLRSGVPMLEANPERPQIKPHDLPEDALKVPIMCNPGTKEGVTEKKGRFARVWPSNETFFKKVRGAGGLVGVSIDPLSSHECGNSRYMAIPWLDACLSARLPKTFGKKLRPMPTKNAWLAPLLGKKAQPKLKFQGNPLEAVWLPNAKIAQTWMQFVEDTKITDPTPPPSPTQLKRKGNQLSWKAEADLESGISHFLIKRNGKVIGQVPEDPTNKFGRPLFQGLLYSDTPIMPLTEMLFIDKSADTGKKYNYQIISVNTVGLKSK